VWQGLGNTMKLNGEVFFVQNVMEEKDYLATFSSPKLDLPSTKTSKIIIINVM
jgi:hypothetical protein